MIIWSQFGYSSTNGDPRGGRQAHLAQGSSLVSLPGALPKGIEFGSTPTPPIKGIIWTQMCLSTLLPSPRPPCHALSVAWQEFQHDCEGPLDKGTLCQRFAYSWICTLRTCWCGLEISKILGVVPQTNFSERASHRNSVSLCACKRDSLGCGDDVRSPPPAY